MKVQGCEGLEDRLDRERGVLGSRRDERPEDTRTQQNQPQSDIEMMAELEAKHMPEQELELKEINYCEDTISSNEGKARYAIRQRKTTKTLNALVDEYCKIARSEGRTVKTDGGGELPYSPTQKEFDLILQRFKQSFGRSPTWDEFLEIGLGSFGFEHEWDFAAKKLTAVGLAIREQEESQ